MNVNGFNLLSPSIQAKEVRLSLIDTASVSRLGSKRHTVSLGTDFGLIGAVGLSPVGNDDYVQNTSWNFAIKLVNATAGPIVVQAVKATLHNKGQLRLITNPDVLSLHEMPLDKMVLPDTATRSEQNVLPILVPAQTERAYYVSMSLQLQQNRLIMGPRYVSIPAANIKEPETYHHFFERCTLRVVTSAGTLKIKFRVPLFVGDKLRIP